MEHASAASNTASRRWHFWGSSKIVLDREIREIVQVGDDHRTRDEIRDLKFSNSTLKMDAADAEARCQMADGKAQLREDYITQHTTSLRRSTINARKSLISARKRFETRGSFCDWIFKSKFGCATRSRMIILELEICELIQVGDNHRTQMFTVTICGPSTRQFAVL